MSRILIEKTKRLLAQEVGAVYKPLEGRLQFALAFPSSYRLGMSSLGLQIVYGILNDMPDVTCERVFLPNRIDARELVRSRTRLFSMESQTPICNFDVVAFSVTYELHYAGIAQMLELSGIPVFSRDRDESHPLIIAGGPCATFNPEPLADLIDVFAVGDAEEMLPEMAAAMREEEGDRESLITALAQIPGVYAPRFYTPVYGEDDALLGMEVHPSAPPRVVRRVVQDLDRFSNSSIILTPEAEFADMLLAEAMRGCKRRCRFCIAGYSALPPRPRKIENLKKGARVGLVGSAVFDHPEALSICESLAEEGREFSISSTRIESLTKELAEMMFDAGQKTLTIAPEAGTERLRRVINKATPDSDIRRVAKIAAKTGFARLKMYFMIGLPCEVDEDVVGIAKLLESVSSEHPRLKLHASVSCFVPKPWTPFQWCAMEENRDLTRRIKLLKDGLGKKANIELSGESPREAYEQAWLARGDRRLGNVIAKAAQMDGKYQRAANELGVDTDFYARRMRTKDEVFPWDHIDLGVRRDFLWKEFQQALAGEISPGCEVGICKRCGVC